MIPDVGDLCRLATARYISNYICPGCTRSYCKNTFSVCSMELTSAMVLKLAKRMNDEMDIFTLGTLGLGMKDEVIERHLHDNRSINMAARAMLNTWKASQPDAKVAYERLCQALRHKDVDMKSLIHEVLQ